VTRQVVVEAPGRQLRIGFFAWPAQVRGQQQSDENEHPTDGRDNVRKSEEADLGIQCSEPYAHDLASVAIEVVTDCGRSTNRNFETMWEWQ